jgi:hypothetical protein
VIRAAAAVAVVLSLATACKKKRELDAIDSVGVAAPGVAPVAPAVSQEPRQVGALLIEAQRKVGAYGITWLSVEYVGPDGLMDPAFARLEVWYGLTKTTTDDPSRKTGAPVVAPAATDRTQCPRVAWANGRWESRKANCSAPGAALHCTVPVIWERAIAKGAPRDAVAKLVTSGTTWRFDIDDPVRDVHFHKSFADDCGAIAEAPDPNVVQDLPPPETLDRAMISNAIGVVRPKVIACADGSSAKGIVKVTVKVAPEGTVSAVTVRDAPDRALGECVKRAITAATFTKTLRGGSFSYPFVF